MSNELLTSNPRLYAERDARKQGRHYTKHVEAMTAEALHSKSDIAAELAHRDIEIERLTAMVQRAQEAALHAQDRWNAALGRNTLPPVAVPDAWLVIEPDGWRYLSGGEGDARAHIEQLGNGGTLYPLYRHSLPPKDGPGSILGCTCIMCEFHRSAEAIERTRLSQTKTACICRPVGCDDGDTYVPNPACRAHETSPQRSPIICSLCGESRASEDDYCPGCEPDDAARVAKHRAAHETSAPQPKCTHCNDNGVIAGGSGLVDEPCMYCDAYRLMLDKLLGRPAPSEFGGAP